jgi:hypothetical protein
MTVGCVVAHATTRRGLTFASSTTSLTMFRPLRPSAVLTMLGMLMTNIRAQTCELIYATFVCGPEMEPAR